MSVKNTWLSLSWINPVLFNCVSVLISINGCVKIAQWCCFYVCRIDQISTVYQNISLTEPRIVPQYERVLLSFIKEIRILNTEMEHLALAVKRYTNSCIYIHTYSCGHQVFFTVLSIQVFRNWVEFKSSVSSEIPRIIFVSITIFWFLSCYMLGTDYM